MGLIASSQQTVGTVSNAGANAYTWFLDVYLNSQNADNNTSNITITGSVDALGSYGWNDYTLPTMKLFNRKVGGAYTELGSVNVNDAPVGSSKTAKLSWTGNIQHEANGTLDIDAKMTFVYAGSTTYISDDCTIEILDIDNADGLTTLTPPSISNIAQVENIAGLATKFGAYIKGKSEVKLTITANGGSSAITQYKAEYDSHIHTSATNEIIIDVDWSGSKDITVSVLAGGRLATQVISISALDYVEPTITNYAVYRHDGSSVTNSGTRLYVVANVEMTSLSTLNTPIALSVEAKKVSDNTTQTKALSVTYSNSVAIVIAGADITLLATEAYVIKLTASDYFTTVIQTLNIAPIGSTLYMDDFRFGVGGQNNQGDNTFTSDWDFYVPKAVVNGKDIEPITVSGWIPVTETITYVSADVPIFVVGTSADMTGKISVGMKIKLTHSTTKYFIVVAISATQITLYGGTDYTLSAGAITNFYYSTWKTPLGFPMQQNKWTVVYTLAPTAVQNTPTDAVWYNVGSIQPVIPIGNWRVNVNVRGWSVRTYTSIAHYVTLSTANNTAGAEPFISYAQTVDGGNDAKQHYMNHFMSGIIDRTTKATYYVNASVAGASYTSIALRSCYVEMICTYL
jgi:hypothetical protein